jgi:hypothetical protein
LNMDRAALLPLPLVLLLLLARAAALQFRADGTFVIVQLTDVHLGEGEESDAKSLQVGSRAEYGSRGELARVARCC